MTDLMTDPAPFAAMLFAALCVLWLAWRAVRSLFRPASGQREPVPHPEAKGARRDPFLGPPAAAAAAAVPDAADILALKGSIDALSRQIALLEKRLAPANTNVAAVVGPKSAPRPERGPEAPATEPPVIVPDRRF